MSNLRQAVERDLGAALAAKATDALCVALVRRHRDEPIGAAVMFAGDTAAIAPLPRDIEKRRAAVAGLDAAFGRTSGAVAEQLRRAQRPPQACWLSRTLHVAVAAELLATVAGDSAVQRIDLAHRIGFEQRAAFVSVTLAAAIAAAESLGLTGKGVAVGVIDSEVRQDHPAFQDRVVRGRNFTAEAFGTPAEHGTGMAGFIAADAPEFRGAAPGATIHNYKVMVPFAAHDTGVTSPDLAIQQALEDGMRVVNCSWGAGPASDGSSPVARACDGAWKAGMTIVKSSGDRHGFTTPGDAEGVIVVGATDMAGTALASDSPHGLAHGDPRPHLVAPGGGEDEHPTTTLRTGGIGRIKGGASVSAAHVTGLVALALEREPLLTPDELRARLIAACVPLVGAAPERQGAGIVNADAFLSKARA